MVPLPDVEAKQSDVQTDEIPSPVPGTLWATQEEKTQDQKVQTPPVEGDRRRIDLGLVAIIIASVSLLLSVIALMRTI
jgi:hypothetical protein